MLAAYTGTQVRAAEEPLLRAGEGDALMQRAAHGLAGAVAGLLRQRRGRVYGARVLVLAGPGNNGGDALFAAAALARRGARTTAVLTAARTHPAALAAFVAAGGRTIELADDGATEQALAEAGLADAIVDGILGTGASGGLREPAAFLVRQLEGLLRGLPGGSGGRAAGEPAGATGHPAGAGGQPAGAAGEPAGAAGEPAGKASRLTDRQGSRPGRPAVVACDLPSGVDADTGQVSGPLLTADLTVTFGAAKTGLLTPPGEGYAGTIQVIDIGLADRLPVPEVRRLEAADLAALLPAPARTDQKYSRGLLGIVAGSAQYPGAAQLSCAGALACGVGMIRYLGPASVAALIHAQSPEVVCSEGTVEDSRVQAWLVGPGLDGEDQRQRARDAFASGLPVVADAGALAVLPDSVPASVILTPHAGELATLLQARGIPVEREQVEADGWAYARRAAELTGATVLLKGATTVVTAPGGATFSQSEGTPWLATAGSGDTLAGILGALAAALADDVDRFAGLGIAAEDRWAALAAAAASLHGRAARQASGGGPLRALDISAAVAAVWRNLTAVPSLVHAGTARRL